MIGKKVIDRLTDNCYLLKSINIIDSETHGSEEHPERHRLLHDTLCLTSVKFCI